MLAMLVAGVSLVAARPSAADTIIAIDQARSLSTENVNAPQCNGDFLFDGDAYSLNSLPHPS